MPNPDAPKHSPTEALALINHAISKGIEKLHEIQGSRRLQSIHLGVQNHHRVPCLGCPHYHWVIWYFKTAKTGTNPGGKVPIASPTKSPTRSAACKRNPKVLQIVRILMKLLNQRKNLVDAISRADRSALATTRLLESYTEG